MCALLFHLLLELVIDRFGHGDAERALDCAALACLLEAFRPAAQIRAAAGCLSLEIERNLALGERTTRISSLFGNISRQPRHCRMGIFFCTIFCRTSACLFSLRLGLRLLDRLRLRLSLCLRLRRNVDLAAGQLGSETGVLTLLADRKGQLIVRER